ncbi:pR113 [rat cytomegalovirus strain Maastricht]|uniref:PR113 n=1 Tax=Rat cytomegalovirus (strain Maastricht) TaxID=79700 RepID=Q9DW86_RCMVM|nr:pR113 [rat cytomegalovirus strain Maastricht]AAF99204.1 pR113 [rat cytomegalovirus strain Maastricht]
MVESEDEDRYRSAASASVAMGGQDNGEGDGGIVAAAAAVAAIVGTGRGRARHRDGVNAAEDDDVTVADVQSLTDSRTRESAPGGGDHHQQHHHPGSEGAGVSDGGSGGGSSVGGGSVHRGEEGLSSNNSALPPVLQIEEGSSRNSNPPFEQQPFEGVFDSLMKLLNECKDKSGKMMTPAGGPSEPSCSSAAAAGCPGVSSRLPTLEELLGRPGNKPVFFNRTEFAPKPVCEIRPFVEGNRNAPAAVPPVAASTARGSRGGSSRRRAPASSTRAPRSRRTRQTRNTSGARGRGGGAGGRSRRGPLLVEDGLEVIEVSDAPGPSVEEETAMAAALLEDLVDLDYDYD